uniref:DDE Tnp4 domain-containing protein n=1 Tax=Haplochromis burtoni TaxID=8153 RepID=A0A3Q2WHR0_HAPBU
AVEPKENHTKRITAAHPVLYKRKCENDPPPEVPGPLFVLCKQGDDMRGFRDLIRMSVENFHYLLERVSPAIIKKDTHLRKAISPRERLSVTLRCLATGKDSFDASLSTCVSQTPSTDSEWKAIARDIANKWQFLHCLGAIDGKHIFIQPPAKSDSMYFNQMSRFSIILMAVVGANYKFVYASAGTQGRVSDAGVFAHSYPASLNTNQRMYNYCLSRAYRVVENAFGILANRFRVFRTTTCLDPDKVVTIIFACLFLHYYLRYHRSDACVPPGYVDSEDYFVSPAGSVSWQEDMV